MLLLGLISSIIKYSLNNNLDRLQLLLLLLLCFERQIIKAELALQQIQPLNFAHSPERAKDFPYGKTDESTVSRNFHLILETILLFLHGFSTVDRISSTILYGERDLSFTRFARTNRERARPGFRKPSNEQLDEGGRVTKTRSRRKQARDARAYTKGETKREEK